MTGIQLAAVRRLLEENQVEFYARFGLSRVTGSKYETSDADVPVLVAQAASRLESTIRMARSGLAFRGWIVAAPEHRELLEALGIRLGPHNAEIGAYTDCWLSPSALERLGPYWGQFLWMVHPQPAPPTRSRLPAPQSRGASTRRSRATASDADAEPA